VPFTGVVSLLGLAEEPAAEHPAVSAGLVSTGTLVEALDEADVDAPLWCVTRGAVSVGRSDRLRSAGQAAL
ncbi:hypothetical protein, partial [Amycolatopsis sp. SID8362]|uniref:hypothetical protein n=1 Tax=Amycolatopsis sp. SID8362 TaxID=2690346 RepID=UPI001369325D